MLKGLVLAGVVVVLSNVGMGQGRGLAAQSQLPPQGSGLITGQVVDADSGKGIPYAPVALIGVAGPGTPSPQGRAGGPNRPFAVLSDSQGRSEERRVGK